MGYLRQNTQLIRSVEFIILILSLLSNDLIVRLKIITDQNGLFRSWLKTYQLINLRSKNGNLLTKRFKLLHFDVPPLPCALRERERESIISFTNTFSPRSIHICLLVLVSCTRSTRYFIKSYFIIVVVHMSN